MVHYDYIREECSDSETGDYISYAIIAVRIKENAGAVTAEEICTVHDVFLYGRQPKLVTLFGKLSCPAFVQEHISMMSYRTL